MYSFQVSDRRSEIVNEEIEEDEFSEEIEDFDYFAPEYNDEEEPDDEDNEREYCD